MAACSTNHSAARTLPLFSRLALMRLTRRVRCSTCSAIGRPTASRRPFDARWHAIELGVAFQPKVACVDGRLVGYEALVRWSHPSLGAIPPDAFIPRAESLHLISLVTDSVAATSMAWFASARAHTSERLAINISAVELTGSDLGTRLLAECKRSGVDPSRIILEVTETSAMANPTESLEVLTRLRLDGFQLSIDDFGTGYSSMVQLSTMPFTEVKIDRSFVHNLGESLPAEVMVRSMLQLSRGLDLECVAEGVETAAALDVLTELGCDFCPGLPHRVPHDRVRPRGMDPRSRRQRLGQRHGAAQLASSGSHNATPLSTRLRCFQSGMCSSITA